MGGARAVLLFLGRVFEPEKSLSRKRWKKRTLLLCLSRHLRSYVFGKETLFFKLASGRLSLWFWKDLSSPKTPLNLLVHQSRSPEILFRAYNMALGISWVFTTNYILWFKF